MGNLSVNKQNTLFFRKKQPQTANARGQTQVNSSIFDDQINAFIDKMSTKKNKDEYQKLLNIFDQNGNGKIADDDMVSKTGLDKYFSKNTPEISEKQLIKEFFSTITGTEEMPDEKTINNLLNVINNLDDKQYNELKTYISNSDGGLPIWLATELNLIKSEIPEFNYRAEDDAYTINVKFIDAAGIEKNSTVNNKTEETIENHFNTFLQNTSNKVVEVKQEDNSIKKSVVDDSGKELFTITYSNKGHIIKTEEYNHETNGYTIKEREYADNELSYTLIETDSNKIPQKGAFVKNGNAEEEIIYNNNGQRLKTIRNGDVVKLYDEKGRIVKDGDNTTFTYNEDGSYQKILRGLGRSAVFYYDNNNQQYKIITKSNTSGEILSEIEKVRDDYGNIIFEITKTYNDETYKIETINLLTGKVTSKIYDIKTNEEIEQSSATNEQEQEFITEVENLTVDNIFSLNVNDFIIETGNKELYIKLADKLKEIINDPEFLEIVNDKKERFLPTALKQDDNYLKILNLIIDDIKKGKNVSSNLATIKKYVKKPEKDIDITNNLDKPNGKLDKPSYQLGEGDCWLLETINSMARTPNGRRMLEEAISIDEKTGNVTVILEGGKKKYTITKEQLAKSRLNIGDADFTAIAEAISLDLLESGKIDSINGGFARNAMLAISGNDEKMAEINDSGKFRIKIDNKFVEINKDNIESLKNRAIILPLNMETIDLLKQFSPNVMINIVMSGQNYGHAYSFEYNEDGTLNLHEPWNNQNTVVVKPTDLCNNKTNGQLEFMIL